MRDHWREWEDGWTELMAFAIRAAGLVDFDDDAPPALVMALEAAITDVQDRARGEVIHAVQSALDAAATEAPVTP